MKIGSVLQSLRKENKLSQEEIAEKLGVSRQSISLWENDQTYPTMENMFALCKIYHVSMSEILEHSPRKNSKDIFHPIILEDFVTFSDVLKLRSGFLISLLAYLCFCGIMILVIYGIIIAIIFVAAIIITVVVGLLLFKSRYSNNKVKKKITFYEDFLEYIIMHKNKMKKFEYYYRNITLDIRQNECYINTPKRRIYFEIYKSLTSDVTNHLENIKTKCLSRLNNTRRNYTIGCVLLTILSFVGFILMLLVVNSKKELWLALILVTVPITNLFFAIKSKNIINKILYVLTIIFASIFLFLTVFGFLVTQLR